MLCTLVKYLENSQRGTVTIAIDASAAHAVFDGRNDPTDGVLQGSAGFCKLHNSLGLTLNNSATYYPVQLSGCSPVAVAVTSPLMLNLACWPCFDCKKSECFDGPRKVGVPMYFWPGLTEPCGWDIVVQAAAHVDLLILNPDSGPGKERIEVFRNKVDTCRAAGQRVLGYVSSDYARRDIRGVLRDIDKYRSWFAIDGFFIDEMYCTDLAGVEYYKQIRKAVKLDRSGEGTSHASQILVFNPGVPQIPEAYMPLADIFVVFEGSAAAYVSYKASKHASKHSTSKFWHIVHSCSTKDLIVGTLQRFHAREAKWLYMTELTMPNPYCTLGHMELWQGLLSYMAARSEVAQSEHLSQLEA